MKARTLQRNENPPVDAYVIDEASFHHYWQFFRPPGAGEEDDVIHHAGIDQQEFLH
jgi:hypothetical protein